jgi:hypothetical protein
MLRNAWIRTLIAFDVRDPLKRTDKSYALPQNFEQLDARSKTRATICNLFGNLRQPIEHIARTYEMSPREVISILVEEGLIIDQRKSKVDPIRGGRRQIDL